MGRLITRFLPAFLLFWAGTLLWGEQYYLEEGDYSINVPVTWRLYDSSDLSNISFIADDQAGILQISYYEGDQFDRVDDMHRYFVEGLETGESDSSRLPYLEWDALITDLTFNSDGNDFRGWFLFLEGDLRDYQVLVFSPVGDYEAAFPYILSCLDSFSPGREALKQPGIISQMFYDPRAAQYEKKTLLFGERAFVFDYDPFELEASQIVIEREAPLLTNFKSGSPQAELAWDRYYKLIYRDNYSRLKNVYRAMESLLDGMGDLDKARALLGWLQSFRYGSSGTFSDLMSPLASIVEETGDCDSLALAYLILLDYAGIDGLLLVSEVYGHAMAAVDVDGQGIAYPLGEKNYLVAEMTKEVGLGQMVADMADFSQWQAVSFP